MSTLVDLAIDAINISETFGTVSSVRHECACQHKHLGNVTRLVVEYSEPIESTQNFVLKRSGECEITNKMAKDFHLYEREVQFYKDIAPHCKAPIPKCYHSTLLNEGATYVLLLEDLHPLKVGDTHEPMTVAQAMAGSRVLAEFHASFWRRQPLLDSFKLMKPSDSRAMLMSAAQSSVVDHFLSTWEDEISDVVKEKILSVACRLDTWIAALEDSEGPHTIIHGDTKQTNLMFSDATKIDENSPEVVERCVLLDFQSFTEGGLLACVDDLSYLLIGGMAIDQWQAHRGELVAHYVDSFNAVAGADSVSVESVTAHLQTASEGLLVRMLLFHMMMMRLPKEVVRTQLGTLVRRAHAALCV